MLLKMDRRYMQICTYSYKPLSSRLKPRGSGQVLPSPTGPCTSTVPLMQVRTPPLLQVLFLKKVGSPFLSEGTAGQNYFFACVLDPGNR